MARLGEFKDQARRKASALMQNAVKIAELEHAKDIDNERQRQATSSTARFVDEHMALVKGHRGANPTEAMFSVLRESLSLAPGEGLYVEFGVATGTTLRAMAEHHLPAYGFDSFDGLPERWRPGYDKGAFAQSLPEVSGAELVIGNFEDTLAVFLGEHPETFAFVHLDADLYSSTRTVFEIAFERFVPGTIVVLDEFFNYPGWQQHEYKAFSEFMERYPGGFEYVNYNAMHEQVTVRLS